MSVPTNLHRDLGRMEGKLDAVLSEMRSGIRLAHERLDRHETEIDTLKAKEVERKALLNTARWGWNFVTAGIGAIAGAFGGGFIR